MAAAAGPSDDAEVRFWFEVQGNVKGNINIDM